MKIDETKNSLITTVLIFFLSGILLLLAISRRIRSNEWTPIVGEIVSNDFGHVGPSHRIRWHKVKVDYSFDQKQHSRHICRFGNQSTSPLGQTITIYVNPNNPAEIAEDKGLRAIDYGIPLAATLGSAGISIVLLCIIFSPKDDHESEINQTLL